MRTCLLALGLLGGLATPALAQQPAQLPTAPTPLPATPEASAPALPPATPAGTAPALPPDAGLLPGHRYEVKTVSGVGFVGILRTVSATELVFESAGLGMLRIERSSLRRLHDLDAADTAETRNALRRASHYDIGNGSRYFFGPSGRNLRRGEGVAQDVWVLLAGANYGLTDYLSLGGYVSLVPGLGVSNQLLMLTPKVGTAIGHNWNLGAGALYIRVPNSDGRAYGAGLLYGVATHGTADSNVSLGLGYGYADGGIGSTPTLYFAGQTRVSRTLSLVSENYAVLAHSPVFAGLYGIKLNWKRASMSIGSFYVGYVDNDTPAYGYSYGGQNDHSFFTFGYLYPAYLDVAIRFGKPYKAQ